MIDVNSLPLVWFTTSLQGNCCHSLGTARSNDQVPQLKFVPARCIDIDMALTLALTWSHWAKFIDTKACFSRRWMAFRSSSPFAEFSSCFAWQNAAKKVNKPKQTSQKEKKIQNTGLNRKDVHAKHAKGTIHRDEDVVPRQDMRWQRAGKCEEVKAYRLPFTCLMIQKWGPWLYCCCLLWCLVAQLKSGPIDMLEAVKCNWSSES